MRLIILSLFMLSALSFKAQSTKSIVSNHVFVMCDEIGDPIDMGSNIYIFMVFHSNGKLNMLMGKDLSAAIEYGSVNSGSWVTSENKVSFTWDDSGKGTDWYRIGNTDNFKTGEGSGIVKNLGGF